jgi:hypothetical protein
MLGAHSPREAREAWERSWGIEKLLFLGESLRPGPGREGAGRGRREDPEQAQQEQVEQGKTSPGNLARAGHGRGNMIVARCSRQDKSEKLRQQCPCREALALGVRVRPTGLMEPRPQGLRPWQPPPHRAHAHHPFRVASISGEKRILHAKTSAPPQRSVRAGTVGGIRPRQVPWTIAARSCSRRLLGLDGPGLTPPCPRHGWIAL